MGKPYEITLLDTWNTAQHLEEALLKSGDPHNSCFTEVLFQFPSGCKIMLDAAARLLSLVNQLAFTGRSVTLAFEGENHSSMTYLNRANFFTILSSCVEITPTQPDPVIPAKFNGNTLRLVEFKSIRPGDGQDSDSVLPTRLAETLLSHLPPDFISSGTIKTIFAELLSNIYDHSQSEIAGFVACQVYLKKQHVQLIVSDSGNGITTTLRPMLTNKSYLAMSDPELVSVIFREGGLSSKGTDRGSGLYACAKMALRYNAKIKVRLPTCNVTLVPSEEGYILDKTSHSTCLSSLKGTHICFDFPLDRF